MSEDVEERARRDDAASEMGRRGALLDVDAVVDDDGMGGERVRPTRLPPASKSAAVPFPIVEVMPKSLRTAAVLRLRSLSARLDSLDRVDSACTATSTLVLLFLSAPTS